MSVTITLSVVQTAVLRALPGWASDEFPNARGLCGLTGFPADANLAACRALAKMGLAGSVRGLLDIDTGLAAGSGWCLTDAGIEALERAEDAAPSIARGEAP
jgi:hypothetical protein